MLMLIGSQISKDNLVLSLISMKDCQGLSFILQKVQERVLFFKHVLFNEGLSYQDCSAYGL